MIKRMNLSHQDLHTKRCNIDEKDTYVAYIRSNHCATENSFFCEISAALQFPWYFGENWPALDDCLCDFDWIPQSKILIVIDDFYLAFSGNLTLQDRLIQYLCVAIEYWRSGVDPSLGIAKKEIEVWLNDNMCQGDGLREP